MSPESATKAGDGGLTAKFRETRAIIQIEMMAQFF
jgi:hypothetical protein